MKKITLLVSLFTLCGTYSQNSGYGTNVETAIQNPTFKNQTEETFTINEECDDVITCDNLENGVFINGSSGQKAAIDIPIDMQTILTINQIKVTLSSGPEPAYVHFKFYKSNDSIPTDLYEEITNTTIIASDSIGYEPMHDFVIRNITLQLETAVVLNGSETTDRFWMSAISDANAWATTDGVSNGADITGKAIAMGGNNFDWFTLGDIEGLYEIDAECESLGIEDQNFINNITIYPNPARDILNIELANATTIQKVEILSITGQILKSFGSYNENLDISSLPKGLYFAKIYSFENQPHIAKFMVSR